MEIKLLTIEKAELLQDGNTYVVAYKPLKFKESSTVKLEVTNIPLNDLSVRAGCTSCTQANVKIENQKAIITITYDTKNVGNFDKRVSFFHQGQLTTIKLKGTVTRW